MGIEKDINQQHFQSEAQKAMINLMYTHSWITERIKEILAEESITMQQFNILRILRGSDPMPLSTLSIRERMLDKMSDTSRIVDRLLAKGLVDVYITSEGKKLLEKLDNKSDVMNSITSKLSNSELEKLNELLDLLRTFKGKKS